MKPSSYTLLPQPRQMTELGGAFTLPKTALIQIICAEPQALLFSVRQFQAWMEQRGLGCWQIAASGFEPVDQTALRLILDPSSANSTPQSYRLLIQTEGITIWAPDAAGIFYGLTTLQQIMAQADGNHLPALEVNDAPDFPVRGVMLDISRDKVYTMQTLYTLVDRFASWKINQLQLYTEHTFAYRNHPLVWEHASPMTGEEILLLDAYCKQRFIELVPNQNSFGHMERWLPLEPYRHLAEIHGEFDVPWGKAHGPFSLAPVEPGSLELIRSLYDELLPHFSSKLFNVGCDETFDLGRGKTKALVAEKGIDKVYLDFLLNIYQEVKRRGSTMLYWADIICNHPDLIPQLPKDAIGLLWGYDADHPFDKQGTDFAAARIPFYVCPGTSSWNTIAGRTENALENLRNAAENGKKHGAIGFLNTDWGDSGHWQVPPISFLGFAAGAAYSWRADSCDGLDVAMALNQYAFADEANIMGDLMADLGNVYTLTGMLVGNSTVFHHILTRPVATFKQYANIDPAKFEAVLTELDRLEANLEQAKMTCADADLIEREVKNTIALVRHACKRVFLAFESDTARQAQMKNALRTELETLLEEFASLWLARARQGGLSDSLKKFDTARADYV